MSLCLLTEKLVPRTSVESFNFFLVSEDIESSADQQISTDSSLVSGQSAAQDPKPPAISGAVISAGVTSQSGLGVLATATLSGSTAASEPVAAAGLGGADSTVAMSGLQHQGSRGGPAGGGALPPGASHSLQHLNKLASEQQQTLAGTLGHGLNYHPSSPVVIQPNTAVTGGDSKPNSDLAGGINGPLTPQSSNTGTPTQGPGANTTTNPSQPQQNGQTPQPQPQSQQQDLQNNNTVKVKTCAGCGARILDRFLLHAMERYWHTGCLKCSCCQAQLGEIGTTCYAKAGMILCKNDYIRSVHLLWFWSRVNTHGVRGGRVMCCLGKVIVSHSLCIGARIAVAAWFISPSSV